jgi:PhoPQ-activated pathogenicity-related protein
LRQDDVTRQLALEVTGAPSKDGYLMLRSRRSTIGRACLALLVTVTSAAALGQATEVGPAQALAAYVAKPDESFGWQVRRRYRHHHAEVIELQLRSQTWQGALWRHQLLLIRPERVDDDRHAALIVGGGRWRDEYETAAPDELFPEDGELFVEIARWLRSPVVVLGQVPYQPLFDLSEDRLIAHTFERYLATGDAEWPLLLPMVKSVVRAFDASSAASVSEGWGPLEQFTVFGGSKRGWATWLTAAVDTRVTAIAPIVIDALNMERHFPHQIEAWGASSEEIRPYTELGLDTVLGSAAGADLRRIVDPFSYRDAITQPKLVILATNDSYFPLDSANLYWDELREPKYLLYLPNEPHSIDGYGPVVRGLRALHTAAAGGEALPRLEWQYEWRDAALALCIRSAPGARRLRIWRAVSAGRDFRTAEWQHLAEVPRSSGRFELARPAAGYVALFGEAEFGRGRRAFSLSTNLAVWQAADEPDYGTRPLGSAGVCAAADLGGTVPLR